MVEDVYTNIQSKIKINGLLSDPFTLTQEVCQGCLFSVLLYIVGAEVLVSFINANKSVKRIQIGDYEILNENVTSNLKTIMMHSAQRFNFSKNQALMSWCI